MSERAPYSRVYWSVMDDPKFDGIRDCRTIGAWLLLLLQADMAWPSPAYLPRPIPKGATDRLVAANLIEVLDGDRFRVVGLDSERDKRQQSARNAAASRWHPEPDASDMPSLAEAEPSRGKAEPSREAREDIVDDYYRLTGRFPTDTVREWVDRLANEFGYDLTSKELGRQYAVDPNTRTLLGRVENELKAGRHIATKRQAEAEKARLEAEARAKDISPAKAADNQRALKALMADWFSKDAA